MTTARRGAVALFPRLALASTAAAQAQRPMSDQPERPRAVSDGAGGR